MSEARREPVRACYPGTFNPPTIAHLAVAHMASEQLGVDQVVFVVSLQTLGKDETALPAPAHRAELLKSLTERHGNRFDVEVSPASLLVDIAAGYDWVIVGADKWEQINELQWYGYEAQRRDEAIAALPNIAIVPRPPFAVPDHREGRVVLRIADRFSDVSSTAVRGGRHDWRAK